MKNASKTIVSASGNALLAHLAMQIGFVYLRNGKMLSSAGAFTFSAITFANSASRLRNLV